jgi:ribonuclease HII
MRRAVEDLALTPDIIYVDGQFTIPGIDGVQKAIIDGDKLIPQISAASILAKVTRDSYMVMCSRHYPEYSFEKHKGYGTREHLEMIKKFGPCPIHRKSFNPISQFQLWDADGTAAK